MSRTRINVKTRHTILNLRRYVAQAVSGAPVKVIARQYDISPREVSSLRTELMLPSVPIFLEIARRDPTLRAQVIALLSGDGEAASPEAINDLVRRA